MKELKKQKISVLLPIYNTNEDFLKESILSILNQTYKNFEFLILNDSPENTNLDKVVNSFKDKRIKYYKNDKNLGISKTLNKLIDLAQGEYIAICNHDDISVNTRLEKEINFLENNKDYGLVSCYFKIFGKVNKICKNPTSDKDIKLALMQSCALIHPGLMIRHSLLLETNIRYDENYSPAEDHYFYYRLIPYTKFHNLNEILLLYRDHEKNTSKTHFDIINYKLYSLFNLMKNEQTETYKEYEFKQKRIKKIKILGFITLFTVLTKLTYQGLEYKNIYLLGLIPLLKIKNEVKL